MRENCTSREQCGVAARAAGDLKEGRGTGRSLVHQRLERWCEVSHTMLHSLCVCLWYVLYNPLFSLLHPVRTCGQSRVVTGYICGAHGVFFSVSLSDGNGGPWEAPSAYPSIPRPGPIPCSRTSAHGMPACPHMHLPFPPHYSSAMELNKASSKFSGW